MPTSLDSLPPNRYRVEPALRSLTKSSGQIAAILAVALVANLAIHFLARAMDARRLEHQQIIRFESSLRAVHGSLDDAIAGEGLAEYDRDKVFLAQAFKAVTVPGNPQELTVSQAAYGQFVAAAATLETEIKAKNIIRAREVDRTVVDPALASLHQAITRLDAHCEALVGRWSLLTTLLTSMALFGSAIVVAILTVRHQAHLRARLTQELQQKAIEASERRFRSLIQNNSDVIGVVTAEGKFKMVSDACEQAWGRAADDLRGQPLVRLVAPADIARVGQFFSDAKPPDGISTMELGVRHADGGLRDYEVHLTNLMEDADIAGVLMTFHDVTERKRMEQELAFQAFHDRLTGLPNRALFLDRLTHRLKVSEHDSTGFAVFFIDLDHFKVVNDSLGHAAGDALLVEVARRLESAQRPADTVARLGGDEFTILVDDGRSIEAVMPIAERILEALRKPIYLEDRPVVVNGSIGIALSSDSAADAGALMRDADTAMYRAKGRGRAAIAVFDRSMNLLANDRLELESDLRLALELGQFHIEYQPIVDIDSGKMREVEAMLGWRHPIRGLVPPSSFISIAEESGLINPIGQWVLDSACAQLERWSNEAGVNGGLGLSVNVSALQLRQSSFADIVRSILRRHHIDAKRLKLEVTESSMLKEMTQIVEVLSELRRIGVRIAIDDFGTGYSSLAYLSALPLDTLKIDRSFITPLGDDSRADGVVQAMITMARTLGLDVTGEGIETGDQLRILRMMGCDAGQGFLFAHSLSARDVSNLLSERGVADRGLGTRFRS